MTEAEARGLVASPSVAWIRDDRMVISGYRGSVAHGTYVPPEEDSSTDDVDLMGVIVPGLDHYFGIKTFGRHGTAEIKPKDLGHPIDAVLYEFRKFVVMLMNGNPNVVALLWLEPQDYLKLHPCIDLARWRRAFASKRIHPAFVGYANSQLKKMTHYSHEGYMGAKRKALVEKIGYDSKNAGHLIRLLRMGVEFMETGTLTVKRPDAAELISIKRGEWSLQKIRDEADVLFARANGAIRKSPLPDEPDRAEVNAICRETLSAALL